MENNSNGTTLVSAFLTNINAFTNIDKYINNGILLLKSTINKVIYLDEYLYEKLKDYENENTKLILFKKEEIYLYQYLEQVPNFSVNSANPSKDSIDYMFIMCNKTEWLRDAIDKNYFNSTNFLWMDFGIRYICSCSDEEFTEKISNLKDKIYHNENEPQIRIGTIWDLNHRYNVNLYTNIAWYFAGGVFGGDKNILIHFAGLMKQKCLEIIMTKNTIMWEVNIWYLIYLENTKLFNNYNCNHNNSLIDGY